jgi:hypothetical protein
LKVLPISGEALNALGLSQKMVKAYIILSISQGQVPDPKFTIDGNLPGRKLSVEAKGAKASDDSPTQKRKFFNM